MEPNMDGSGSKRRKVRKGTRSCWECKGRKIKCIYSSPEDTVCDGCFRRGIKCVSQELPEHPLAPVDRRRQIGNRMNRVESLLEKLVNKVDDGPVEEGIIAPEPATRDAGVLTPLSTGTWQHTVSAPSLSPGEDAIESGRSTFDPNDSSNVLKPVASESSRLESTSKALLSTFPSQESIDRVIDTAGPMPSFFHQLVYTPYNDFRIGENDRHEKIAELSIRHTPETHPLIIARQMLLLAITFHYIDPLSHQELKGFSESPGIVMRRMADAAVGVTETNDQMMRTIEGLECLVLVSTFQADNGDLRDAWLTIRRAMLTAQSMSLHRQRHVSPKTMRQDSKWDSHFLWYRIVYYDRFYSLVLGLPQGTVDSSMGEGASFENDTLMGRLERRHAVLAGRILQRNERDPSSDSFNDTQAMDGELRILSESMPSRWWLAPNLASIKDTVELFWAAIRTFDQVFHYILLSHLHLPFLLRSSWGSDHQGYEYSRVACINASRECLNRYRAIRSYSSASYCCHSMDFFAITASMALILAHLDGRRYGNHLDTALAHQRISDRGIMEEILENMERVGTLEKAKTLSERGAGVLRRLLAIEADAAQGSSYCIEAGDKAQSSARALRLNIPYLGLITITKDGEVPNVHESHDFDEMDGYGTSNAVTNGDIQRKDSQPIHVHNTSTTHMMGSGLQNRQASTGQRTDDLNRTEILDSNQGPADSQVDWSFQGVDMTIFDSLMRESDAQIDGYGDDWWLL